MPTPYVDDDADLSLIQDRNVAVIGYDDVARAQALCLRDSGVDVRVGLATGSPLWDEAESDGLRVVTTYEACEEADALVLTSAPADDEPATDHLMANLVEGDVVILGADVNLPGDPPAGVDVVRIIPWTSGQAIRDEYDSGRGAPAFAAVVVDASEAAWDLVLSYARGIGATRAGVVRTTDDEYASAHHFAQTTLLRGGVLSVVRTGFDSLVEAGCRPEVAYLHCILGLKRFADGLLYGVLDAELAAARAVGAGTPSEDPMPAAAARVRALMGWDRADQARLD